MVPCPFCEAPLPEAALSSGNAGLGICVRCFNPVLTGWRDGADKAAPLAGARDIRRIAPPESIGAALLAQTAQNLDDLPVLPEMSQRILHLLKDPEFSLPELTALIKEDPVIAVAVMRQANSAAFGGLHEIKDLNGACARLGMKTIANTVQIVANRNLFITGNAALKNSMGRLWHHSVATAHCADEISRLTLAPDREAIFLAGLIHDIGKVLLLEMAASPGGNALRELKTNTALLAEIMENFHGLLGLLVCQAWQLPPTLRAAVYFHHQPDSCPEKEWTPTVHTVALANAIALVEGYGMHETAQEVFLSSHPSTLHLGLTDIKLATLRVDLADTLEALFEIAG